jgi:DNA-binding CsgD family transcriptional regulator/PAS domain-containing protein
MGYTLSLRDSRQAGECARILAAPFEFADFAGWSSAASESLRELLGADKATFAVSEGGRLHRHSEVITPAALREYIDHYLVADKFGLLTRGLKLGAGNRALCWGAHRREILRSAYWHDLVRPARAFDTVMLCASVDSTAGIANLQFYHDQETGPTFGPRGLAIARAVFPAFASGSRTWVALQGYSKQLSTLLDTMPVAVVLARGDGHIVHENAGVRRMLASIPSDNALKRSITDCIDRFRRAWSSRDATVRPAPPRPTASVYQVSGSTFRLSTSSLGKDVLPGGVAIVVVVELLGPPLFPAVLLRDRYNLTKREIEVTRLLAEGKTNLEMAAALNVSAPTARHHTESVMLKLGVNARGKIALILAALTSVLGSTDVRQE